MRRLVIVFVLFTILITSGVVVYADSGYTLSTDETTIPIPAQSYTISGTQVTIETLTRVPDSEDLPVSIEAPVFNEEYSLILYNKDKQRVWSQTLEGDSETTVPTSQISAETYVVVINGPDGDLRAVRPIVVAGYSVSISHPSSATVDQPVSISISTTEFNEQSPDAANVQVVFTTADGVREVTLSSTGGGEYTGEVTFQEQTTVQLYGVIRGYDRIQDDGQREALGASRASEIVISEPTPTQTNSPTAPPTSPPTATETPSDTGSGSGGGSGGGGGGGDTGGAATNTQTDTPTTTAPGTVGRTPKSTSSSPPTVSTQTDQSTAQTESTFTSTSTPPQTTAQTPTDVSTAQTRSSTTSTGNTRTASDVITPNSTEVVTTQPSTTAETPLSPVLTLVALVFTAVASLYRNTRQDES